MKILYQILDGSEILDKYLQLFSNISREKVVTEIRKHLKQSFENNSLGARTINTLIHQYFVKGGKLEDKTVKEVTFNKKLSFD